GPPRRLLAAAGLSDPGAETGLRRLCELARRGHPCPWPAARRAVRARAATRPDGFEGRPAPLERLGAADALHLLHATDATGSAPGRFPHPPHRPDVAGRGLLDRDRTRHDRGLPAIRCGLP